MISKEFLKLLKILDEADERTLLILQGPGGCGKSFLMDAISLCFGADKIEEVHYDNGDNTYFHHRAGFPGKIRLRDALPGSLNLSANDVLIPWIREIWIVQFHRNQIGEFESPKHLADEMEKIWNSKEYEKFLEQKI